MYKFGGKKQGGKRVGAWIVFSAFNVDKKCFGSH